MKKFELLDIATAPDGTEFSLFRHDGNFSIRVHGAEVVSTRRHYSEDQLAEIVCAPLRSVKGARVLIGGLGFGFTLRAALRVLASDAEIIVVEPVLGIVKWNENLEYELAGVALHDPRVTVRVSAVARTLASSPGSYDAIMLGVDNAVDALTMTRDAVLDHETGIHLAMSCLRPNGEVAFWSASPNATFAASLRRCGVRARTVEARAHATSGPRHVIYIGAGGTQA